MLASTLVLFSLVNYVVGIRIRYKHGLFEALVPNYRVIFASLNYTHPSALRALLSIVNKDSALQVHFSYQSMNFSKISCHAIHDAFIDRPELHRWLLPLSLVLGNLELANILDWDRYNLEVVYLSWNCKRLHREPWKGRIYGLLANHPERLGQGIIGLIALKHSILPSWLINSAQYSMEDIRSWSVSLPTILYLVQASLFNIGLSVPLIPLISELDQVTLHEKFFSTPRNVSLFYKVLEGMFAHLEGKPMAEHAIWHGKLLLIALLTPGSDLIPGNFPTSLVTDFLTAYQIEDYQVSLLEFISGPIIRLQVLSRSLDLTLARRITQIYERHPNLPPFWGNKEIFLQKWRTSLWSLGVLTPTLQAATLTKICELFVSIIRLPVFIFYRNFPSPLELRFADGTIQECTNIDCFLNTIPEMIFKETHAFYSDANGRRIAPVIESPNLWQAISLLITWGYYYQSRDVFALSPAFWGMLYGYAASRETLPEEYQNHEGIQIVKDSLMKLSLFRATRFQFIPDIAIYSNL